MLSDVTQLFSVTLHRTSFQLSKPSDATHSAARPMGQTGRGRRLPQPGQLTIGDDLLGYHNNTIRLWVRDVNKATEYKAKARTFKAKATSISPRPGQGQKQSPRPRPRCSRPRPMYCYYYCMLVITQQF